MWLIRVRTILTITAILQCATSRSQPPVSAGYEVVYSNKQDLPKAFSGIWEANGLSGAGTLSLDGDLFLFSVFPGRSYVVNLKSLDVETIKESPHFSVAWFASESQHVFELQPRKPVPNGQANIRTDDNLDLYCYQTLGDFRKAKPQWRIQQINKSQFTVRWIPEIERFLVSDIEGGSSMKGPTALSILKDNGEVEAQFELPGCVLATDYVDGRIIAFHRLDTRPNLIQQTQFDRASKSKLSSEILKNAAFPGQGRKSFTSGFSTGTRYIKLRDLKSGDVSDYFENYLTPEHIGYARVPFEYFPEPITLPNMRFGWRQWNLNQLAAAQLSDVPEIFRTRVLGAITRGPDFVHSQDGSYWPLGFQEVTDGFFSEGTRLVVTQYVEAYAKEEPKAVVQVLRLK